MKTINILINKELSNSFNSWGIYIGYVIFFSVCGFYTWLSNNNVFYLGQATMLPVFIIINWTQFFLIPALTMRSLADEKRNGTLELLLTKPIKTSEFISGKFLSNLIIAAIALALTLPYYLSLSLLGTIDHGSTLLGYSGLLCMAACCISIGIFASSLSRTPLTAFFIHYGIGLCFQTLFSTLATQFHNGIITKTLNYLSMEEHFDSLSRGILDTRDIIYFCSVCAVFLALSKFFVCKSRF